MSAIEPVTGTMRAALYRHTGPSDVITVEEVAIPQPQPGWVRIRVTQSGVNPTDWKRRAGATAGGPDGFQIPHHDGAGVIDALGDGVEGLRVGQRVWTYFAAAASAYGTAAEYCVVPAHQAVALPDGVSDELGASLGVPAVTAAHTLGGDPSTLEGTSVLVHGGAGAVGHFAIELAKQAGARVAATASSPEKAMLAKEAGADFVVNYRDADAVTKLQGFAGTFNRIVELALGANLEIDLGVAGPGTIVSVYANEADDPALPTRRLMAANITIGWSLLYGVGPGALARAVAWTSSALAEGALTELPGRHFALDACAAAQDAVEGGLIGKAFVTP